MIKSTLNKGFHMVFENGLEISVQFGTGNYCKNRNVLPNECEVDGITTSEDAEVAVFSPSGDIITDKIFHGSDLYIGYVKPDRIAEMINVVKNY